jgi:hypothetical protein
MRIGAWRVDLHAPHLRQALFQLTIERVNARGHARTPDPLVQIERLRERPTMLERVKPAGRDTPREYGRRRPVPPGDPAGGHVERRDRGAHGGPGARASPDQPRATGAEDPLVTTGDEEVAAELGDDVLSRPEAVDPIHADEGTVLLIAPGVRASHGGGDVRHWDAYTGARMDPRERDHTGARRQRSRHGADHLLLRGTLGSHVERDALQARTRARNSVLERHLRRVVIVLRREDLVARAEVERRIEEPEAHGGAVGQRDLVGVAADVSRRGEARFLFEAASVRLQVRDWVLVEASTMSFDRLAHGRGMRREQQAGHVDPVARERE